MKPHSTYLVKCEQQGALAQSTRDLCPLEGTKNPSSTTFWSSVNAIQYIKSRYSRFDPLSRCIRNSMGASLPVMVFVKPQITPGSTHSLICCKQVRRLLLLSYDNLNTCADDVKIRRNEGPDRLSPFFTQCQL